MLFPCLFRDVLVRNPLSVLAQVRPDTSGMPAPQQKALSQLERRGWGGMRWSDGYSLLHWAAKNGQADLCAYASAPQSTPF